MKKFTFWASVALLVMSASASFADVFPPTFWRCAGDQLFGHPSEGTTAETRTGLGRTQWATGAYSYYFNGPGNDRVNARRYWLSAFNADVEDFATLYDTDLYPVYLNTGITLPDGTNPLWVGPGPNRPDIFFGMTRSAIRSIPYTGGFNLPTGVQVDALCESGCYSPDQEIRVGNGFVSVAKAHESGESRLTTLDPNATIDSIKFMGNTIARWTVDIAPTQQTIFTLRMKSGGQLRVTNEHPLVTSEGVMKQAQTLVVGEELVRDNGSPDPVVSIVKTTELTKVYNLRPTTTDLTSNILVAQGYLSGSARYQNEFVKYLNRVLFRHKIPSAVIVRRAPATARVTTKQN